MIECERMLHNEDIKHCLDMNNNLSVSINQVWTWLIWRKSVKQNSSNGLKNNVHHLQDVVSFNFLDLKNDG